MELLESLLVNKKNFKILATIYIVVVIIVLLLIWWPEKTLEIAQYESYDETEKNKEMLTYYLNFLEDIKQYNDVEALEDYFSYGYLKYNDMSIEKAMWILKSTDASYVLKNFDLHEYDNNYIYSVSIPSVDSELKVNFIEQNYPYNFYITYDTFVDYSNLTYSSRVGQVDLIITGTHRDLNYIEYELSVTNDYYNNLTFDFLDADNFKLNLENGKSISLDLVQSTKDKVDVAKDETVVMKLVFDVVIENQNEISSLSINGISADSSNLTTTISL